jgi:prepilin-type processing-associated H-X9-DG protein
MRRRASKGFTAVELTVVILLVVLLVLLLILIPALRRTRDAGWQATCTENLKNWGVVLRTYAAESPKGLYPPMHGREMFGEAEKAVGCKGIQDDFDFCPDIRVLCPDYLNPEAVAPGGDPRHSILVCPANANARTDNPIGLVSDDGSGNCAHTGLVTNGDVSYFYLPWIARDVRCCAFHHPPLPAIEPEVVRVHGLLTHGPPQLVALVEHIGLAMTLDPPLAHEALDAEINVAVLFAALGEPYTKAGHGSHTVVERLQRNSERLMFPCGFATAGCSIFAESEIPVLFDRFFVDPHAPLHRKPGGNVLFMDGHVEFKEFPGKFPVTDEFARILRVIEELPVPP